MDQFQGHTLEGVHTALSCDCIHGGLDAVDDGVFANAGGSNEHHTLVWKDPPIYLVNPAAPAEDAADSREPSSYLVTEGNFCHREIVGKVADDTPLGDVTELHYMPSISP